MSHLFGFGYSLENERLDAAVLGLPGGSFLSVASGGEVPLGLLAQGADQVTAIDVSSAQLHLVRLKLAAVQAITREEAIAFLGYLPAQPAQRSAWYAKVRPSLTEASCRFWDKNPSAVEKGAIHSGRFGAYVRRIVWGIRTFLRRGRALRELMECRTTVEQEDCVRRHFDRFWVRRAFHLAFHPRLLAAFGLDARSMRSLDREASFGMYCFGVVRNALTRTSIRENHVIQLLLNGRVLSADAVPVFLSPGGFPVVRERAECLKTVEANITEWISAEDVPGPFDGFHLSNVPDWISQEEFERMLGGMVRASTKNARFLSRQTHARRVIPDQLSDSVCADESWGAELAKRAMFPIYDLIPGTLNGTCP